MRETDAIHAVVVQANGAFSTGVDVKGGGTWFQELSG